MPPLYLCIHLRNFFRNFAGNIPRDIAGDIAGCQGAGGQQEESALAALLRCAQRFSPRVEVLRPPQPPDGPQQPNGEATLLLDLAGAERLLGSPRQIATALYRALSALLRQGGARPADGISPVDGISLATGQHASAAILAARGGTGICVLAPGGEAAALAPLPLSVLELEADEAATLESWGIRTLGELAALPTRSLAARLGKSGVHLQAQARGAGSHLLVPCVEPADAPLCESIELEHPVARLEPLLFLLAGMLERLTARAAGRALAIGALELCLVLDAAAVSNAAPNVVLSPAREHRCTEHGYTERGCTVRPTLPERDPRTLLKLLQLELELHPPEAGEEGSIVGMRLTAFPAPPQRAQHGLFAAQAPEAGAMEVLLARLRKLAGEGRVGAAELLDTHAPEAFRMTKFAPEASAPFAARSPESRAKHPEPDLPAHPPALRMLRPPRAVGIELRSGEPVAMRDSGERSIVEARSGPWRSDGAWWTEQAWCREEWEVAVGAAKNSGGLAHAPPRCLRLAHDPASGDWYVIGVYD